MNKREAAKLAGQTVFIYLFREIKTGKIIYVGQTKYIGRRLNEHRASLADIHNHKGIYHYMRDNNLEFYRDVEICIVREVFGRDLASKIESEYIEKYKDTVQNIVTVDSRKYNTDPRLKKVRNVTTGEVFWAVQPVMEKYKISRYFLDKAIKRKDVIAGCLFEYVE